MRRSVLVILLALATLTQAGDPPLPGGVKDTQNPKDLPPTPEQAVKQIKVPEGFQVTLFAGEPDVQQPIAASFDDRGRLWVAECYSYPDWKPGEVGRDRIVVLEDTNSDGRFDRRQVFWDRAYNLSGIEYGYGGVWVCCAPHLLFIPDRDGDLKPDGKPEVVLDGWTLDAKHNIVNGLIWGPDGWLYGCHGIIADSLVGRPGTPAKERTRINCGVWRYHPTRKTVEAVCHGTTNPWGLDFDEHGEGFFINCVIGHLWHMIPGARYQRMYGVDFNPHSYQLIDACSDHLHWGGGHWTSSRGGQGIHNEAGGGHAHSGLLAYLGDNWPAKYRNSLLMCNIHGNRLNRDIPQRHGTGYVAKHAPDLFPSSNPWLRGVALKTGPEGAVYWLDWSDLGECHDYDGVHRSSGRIYRVAYGKPRVEANLDLAKKTDTELVNLQLHGNDWYVRKARRLLAERAASGKLSARVPEQLQQLYETQTDIPKKLRVLWALFGIDARPAWLIKQLDHPNEHIRCWAIRLLLDQGAPTAEVLRKFADLAASDASGLVRLALASALQRLPLGDRFTLATRLAARAEDAKDHNQPLLIWYGIEPAVADNPDAGLQLASGAEIPLIRQFLARRLTEAENRTALNTLITQLGESTSAPLQLDLLAGIRTGLKGRRSVPMPSVWPKAYAQLSRSRSNEVRGAARLLAIVFDDPEALRELRQTLMARSAPTEQRLDALNALTSKGVQELPTLLFHLLGDPAIRGAALRSLGAFSHPETAPKILALYGTLTASEKQEALTTLASRPAYASALLDAIEKKSLPRTDLSAFTARQIHDLRDRPLSARLEKVWGSLRQPPAEKKKLIEKYQQELTKDVIAKANLAHGRQVFSRTCMQCHMLFGEGNKIGPDLTGSNRKDLYYILENSVDPSAVIGRDYQLTNIFTNKGRLVAGIIVEETNRAVTVQTPTERVTLSREEIEERQIGSVSMMPEGQLEKLTLEERRDLVGYLRSEKQVPLPK